MPDEDGPTTNSRISHQNLVLFQHQRASFVYIHAPQTRGIPPHKSRVRALGAASCDHSLTETRLQLRPRRCAPQAKAADDGRGDMVHDNSDNDVCLALPVVRRGVESASERSSQTPLLRFQLIPTTLARPSTLRAVDALG